MTGLELDAALAQLAETHPGVNLTRDDLARWVEQRPEAKPGQLVDLALACACCSGDGAALQAFRQVVGDEARRSVKRLGLGDVALEEVMTSLEDRLLGLHGGAPQLASYSGIGPLRAWVRMVAVRAGLRAKGQGSASPPAAEAEVLSPELAYLKSLYGAPLRRCLADSMAALSIRDRNLLRLHFLDGVSAERLGVMHSVHRVTAYRWLQAAIEALSRGVRTRLADELELTPDSIDSLMKVMRSELSLNLENLAPPMQQPPKG